MMIRILVIGRIIIHVHILKTKLEKQGHLLELRKFLRLPEEGPRVSGHIL